MQLEEEIANNLAKQISDDIDWEILSEICVDQGFVKVTIDTSYDMNKEWELKVWAIANCKNNFQSRGNTFLFEDVQDANWFKLRWLS
jgi:hypothetical protein